MAGDGKINPATTAAAKELDRLQKAFSAVAQSAEGRVVLKEIIRRCGYDKSSVALQAGNEVNVNLMIYLEARRTLWLELRKFMDKKHLKEIEYL